MIVQSGIMEKGEEEKVVRAKTKSSVALMHFPGHPPPPKEKKNPDSNAVKREQCCGSQKASKMCCVRDESFVQIQLMWK